jgi:exosome complex component RRP4
MAESSSALSSLVLPGQPITGEPGYLRGHGSYFDVTEEGSMLIASVAGQIERIDKLISVKPPKSRYLAEIGDLVVGRISAVESKRWKVDICSQKDANLQLSSVNLPGGAQRIRTHEDQLQMRSLFTESDLISAEVQNVNADGSASLHTRSLKYGKLENGQLAIVPASLIKRLPQHYISLPWGVDVLLGKNGYIWITST